MDQQKISQTVRFRAQGEGSSTAPMPIKCERVLSRVLPTRGTRAQCTCVLIFWL